MDEIFVKNLRLAMSIGVEPFEREWRQPVQVSLLIRVSSAIRRSGAYYSYAPAVEHLREIASSGEHIDLIETLAEIAGRRVLEDTRVDSVEVSVAKPDIFHDAEAVGITILMTRDDL
ncbi:dihydroneopterin aldolase [Palleronia aestuarii]|uniref:Dihydroneopterin aldolase n=1 Tax=Palleronia aestuarii TaxID=568105 RepID=A0A2W7NG97_9RHOB|nr:dihydroneopterin aldolase [Palleronia aestuarii]PZX18513.1 dihydroneopterin aldolase [Palleronia aestuarii]